MDKLRGRINKPNPTNKVNNDNEESQVLGGAGENNEILVHSYQELLWKDFELHWIFVTELKLLLDIFVALSNLNAWESLKGIVSIGGLFSGLLSVYRVWTYGR